LSVRLLFADARAASPNDDADVDRPVVAPPRVGADVIADLGADAEARLEPDIGAGVEGVEAALAA
jgi:hypothetical protein